MAGNIETARDLGAGVYTKTETDAKIVELAPLPTKADIDALNVDADTLDGLSASQLGVPTGVITMWSGSVSSVPAGWYLCDGSNGTPDLRNTFVYGASSDGEVNTTGGSANAVAVSHSHTGSSASAGNHGHTGSTNTTGNHNHSLTMRGHYNGRVNVGGGLSEVYGTAYTNTTGNHSHTVSIDSAGSHSHTVTVNSAGESGTNKNLPPYMKLAYIMKG